MLRNPNMWRVRAMLAGVAMLLIASASTAQNWRQLPGAAHDIGVGANGAAWVIGTNAEGSGNYGIYRFNAGSNNWDKMPGAAVRIDVGPDGNAWVVNSAGGIYRWTGSTWAQMPGAAKDVGIGANGTVWVIGTNAEAGGFGIYRWNPRANNWDKIPGSAVRIDVDPAGNAWVVTSGHAIFRYNGSAFVQLPGAALDIGIGGDGTVYVVGTDNGVYRWDGSNWQKATGGLTDISVDGKGNPWGVNASKQIYASSAAATPPPPVAGQVPAVVAQFAPILRFDGGSGNYGYPMSANDYYKQIVQTKSTARLQNSDRNTLASGNIPVYYHLDQFGSQYRIRYWIFFGYQAPCISDKGEHNGDWENITVITTEGGGDVAAVLFGQHGGHYMRIAGPRDAPCTPGGIGRCGGSGGFEKSGTHPVVYVGRIAHGLYHDASSGAGDISGANCAYYLDSRDGRGPSFETWRKLVSLKGNDEEWMAADRQQNFPWGHDGVNTHPTMSPATASMQACTGSAIQGVSDAGCFKSECLSGDDQAAERCIKECEPGYTNVGLTCNKGKWPWEWSVYGRLDGGRWYGYGYTIPTKDAGLKRRRSGGEWNLP